MECGAESSGDCTTINNAISPMTCGVHEVHADADADGCDECVFGVDFSLSAGEFRRHLVTGVEDLRSAIISDRSQPHRKKGPECYYRPALST